MLVAAFPAGPVGHQLLRLLAVGPGEECVVIDPGKDAASGVADVVREHRLRPAAVLLTHGHIDHVWSVTPVAGAYEAAAYIHPADRHLLTDPMAGVSAETAAFLLGGDYEFAEPDDVRELSDGQRLTVAGLDLLVDHAPGHTRGSVTFRSPYDGPEDVPELMFSGDLLFAGSIGRTDLPGGDHPTMLQKPRSKVLPLDDASSCCPATGRRRRSGASGRPNPYLQTWPSARQAAPRARAMSRPDPAERVPRAAARPAQRRARRHRPAPACLRAARLREHRDPRRRADRPAGQGR